MSFSFVVEGLCVPTISAFGLLGKVQLLSSVRLSKSQFINDHNKISPSSSFLSQCSVLSCNSLERLQLPSYTGLVLYQSCNLKFLIEGNSLCIHILRSNREKLEFSISFTEVLTQA